MAKQLNVNLSMTADTSKAKTSLQDLQKQLDQLMLTAQKSSHGQLGISQDIQKATALAAQLKVQLESATSATGNLDLTKFYNSLQKSKTSIMDYKNALIALGPTGTQVFSNLASSIMKAEVPLRRTSARMQEFLTTLKNTARWQISSSILHGFMGALQGAYGYAQDLNESLNNIRIVTGQSVDQMAQFAEQANRAAKELSTTTTAYTDAALIYYQQGLGDKAVKERTDVTMKLANVSRQSAEEVSSQMTAIWNNFADGSKSLEYYADVITKLGASTAASSAEISDGIQKFAAVADTVGLSYEKATAALATVVAETRQSADVVGTAFKTLFARVQGLNLGETLEDGVTLNKYSKALETVGVNILTANGELKNMDSILDELGERWNAIGEEQKVALAETVAGTRQYAQFMAIMENYDKILANQQVAAGSEGALQKQQETFAEGWEAASKRVKAAAQDIYNDLLNDKFFITLLNGFEKVLTAIDNFIESIGGLKTLLPLIGSIVTQVFGNQISASIRNAVNNLKMFTAAGRASVENTRTQTQEALLQTATQNMPGGQGAGMTASLQAQYEVQEALKQKASELTEEEIKQAQILADVVAAKGQEAIEAGKALDLQKQTTKEIEQQLKANAFKAGGSQVYSTVGTEITNLKKAYSDLNKATDIFYEKLSDKNIDSSNITKYSSDIQQLINNLKNSGVDVENLQELLQDLDQQLAAGQVDAAAVNFETLSSIIESGLVPDLDSLTIALLDVFPTEKQARDAAEALANSLQAERDRALDAAETNEQVGETGSQMAERIRQMSSSTDLFATSLATVSSLLMSLTTAINAIKNIGNIWRSEDLTAGEKVAQTLTNLAMLIPIITALTSKNTLALAANLLHTVGLTKTKWLHSVATHAETVATKGAAAANLTFGASLGVVMAALLPLIAVIGVAIAVYSHYEKIKKEHLEELHDEAVKTKEISDANKELIKTNEELINSYKKALKTFEEIGDNKAELQDAALQVAEAYGIENAALLVQQQRYEDLTRAIEDAQRAGQKKALNDVTTAIATNYADFAETNEGKNKNAGSTWSYLVGPNQRRYSFGNTSGDSYKAAELRQLMDQQGYSSLKYTGDDWGIKFTGTASNDTAGFIQLYEEAIDFIGKAASSGIENITKNAAYQGLKQWTAGVEESYNVLKELVDEQEQYQISLQASNIINNATINSFADYEAVLEQLKNTFRATFSDKTEAEITKIAEAQLKLNIRTTEASEKYTNLKNLQQQTGVAYETLQSYYGEYGDLIYRISPDLFASKEALEEAIKELQLDADQESIKLRIVAYRSASADWKANMTEAEILKFFENYSDLFPDASSQLDFLNMASYSDQLSWLQSGEASSILQEGLFNNTKIGVDNRLTTLNKTLEEKKQLQGIAGSNGDFETVNNIAAQIIKIQTEIDELNAEVPKVEELAQKLNDIEQSTFANKLFTEADNLQKTANALNSLSKLGITISASQVAEKIQELAEAYPECTIELQRYNKAVAESGVKSQQATIAYNSLLKSLQQAEINKAANDIKKLFENFDELDERAQEDRYGQAAIALQEVLGHAEKLTGDFLQARQEDLNTFLNGSEEESKAAIERIYDALTTESERYQDAMDQARAGNSDVEFKITINDEEFTFKWGEILEHWNELTSQEQAELTVFLEGKADISSVLRSLTTLENKSQYVANLLAQIGNTDLTFTETIASDLANLASLMQDDRFQGLSQTSLMSAIQKRLKVTGTYPKSGYVDMGSSGSSGGGGGGSAKDNRQAEKAHKNVIEEKERYHLLNEELDDLSREYDKAGKAKDRLFGANKIRAINEEIKALDKLIAHNQSYLKAIEAYRKKDRAALVSGGLSKEWVDSNGDLKTFLSKGVGNVQFDKFGNVENYDAIIEHAVAEYNAAVDAYNQVAHAEGVAEEDVKLVEDIFKQAEMQYELTMEALQQYEETNNKFQEKIEEIRESVREQQDKRFEEWSYKLELKIKINDEDKRYLEYFRKHLERFAKDAFAPVTELLSIWNNTGAKSDWTVLQQGAADLKSATEELMAASHGDPVIDENTGAVLEDFMYSQADWMQGLDDCEDKIYAQIDALYELDDTMSHYYEETLSDAEARLDKYIGKIEDCTAVLKHYQTILELLNKPDNYKWMGEILRAQGDTIQKELQAAQTEFAYADQQYQTMLARYEATKNSVDEGTRQLMEDELQAQYESRQKWQDAMLTKAEEFGQALIAIYENTVKESGKIMEDALTNGQGWDSMLSSMERVGTYQDMMLTKTNQIYETNKLMRKLSQDIDKSDSAAAKTKLSNFRQEIADMQNLNEMSKFDLDVANARYEVLKAQIALEEAQNAKSIVRLQRDNEGNYGYVYTADAAAMDNAQQDLEDKQNDLYNLTLNKANETTEALIQLDKEFTEELDRIAIEFRGNQEKIEEESQRAYEEYLNIRSQLTKDHALADYWQHQVSITGTNEAYREFYLSNTADMDAWSEASQQHISDIYDAHNELTTNMQEYVEPMIGQSLEGLTEKTNTLRKASEEYSKWFDNFASTNAQRLDQIAAITHEYYLQRQEVEALISSLEELVRKINEARAAEAADNGSSGSSNNEPADWSLEMYRTYGTDAYAGNMVGRDKKMASTGMSESQYIYDTNTIDKIITEIHRAGMESWFENTMGSSFANIKAAARAGNDPFVELLKKKITGLFSGGYTGEWGPSGKLAFLHEKELVLNAQDTDNLLSAINLVRELNSMIDLRAASSSFNDLLRSPNYTNSGAALEQIVTIQAEFPNAVNHYEIEEAFNTLINRASQYANRK